MRILDSLVRSRAPQVEERGWGFDPYILSQPWATWVGSRPETTDGTFRSYVDQIHKQNGVVSAAVAARALLISQVRFQWRRGYSQAKRGELWGNRDLNILERPGAMTRPEFLNRLERDVSYSGNAYVVRDGNTLRRLSPDRVSFVMRSASMDGWTGEDVSTTIPYDAEVVGIAYHNERNGNVSEVFMVGDYAHWMPEPDPIHWWRGESWVSAVVREVLTDGQSVEHIGKFFENAATPNMVFRFPEYRTPDEVAAFAELLNRKHAGTSNAWRNMFLAGGADVQVVGASLDNLSLKELTGGFETRIAARARIPGVILGIREGYQGSSLNAGNYSSARRMWADGWFSPTVDSLCAALESIVPAPGGSELSHDPKAVLFLQEDQQDAAQILQTQAVTMRQLVEAGYDPSTVTEAVTTGDMTKLVHTGNVSVQLQPPGTVQESKSATRSAEPSQPQQLTFNMPERSVTVNVPEQAAPVVNVDARQEPPVVNVENRMPDMAAPMVNVNVEPTPVTIENTVEVDPTPVTIDNRVDVAPAEVPPAQVTVVPSPEEPSVFKVKRDRDGRITEVVED